MSFDRALDYDAVRFSDYEYMQHFLRLYSHFHYDPPPPFLTPPAVPLYLFPCPTFTLVLRNFLEPSLI